MANATEVRVGLDGVVVAETRLSLVDGEHGRLVVRGHDVEALARTRRFEDVAALLWRGALPDAAESWELARELGGARSRAFALVPALRDALGAPYGMEALRAAAASLREAPGESAHALRVRLSAALGVFAAAWARSRSGKAPVAPDPTLAHAADLLRCVRGEPASAAEVAALDAYLVTVAEHGMNASTFTARVVASTGSTRSRPSSPRSAHSRARCTGAHRGPCSTCSTASARRRTRRRGCARSSTRASA
jgi:citrate synthase